MKIIIMILSLVLLYILFSPVYRCDYLHSLTIDSGEVTTNYCEKVEAWNN